MSMAVEYRPQPLGGSFGYDNRYNQPQFTDPWNHPSAAPPASYSGQYSSQSPTQMEHSQIHKSTPIPSMGYAANPAASSLGSELVPSRSYGSSYGSSMPPTSQPSYTSAPSARYSPERAAVPISYGYESGPSRRSSYAASGSSRASFSDELASARGMVAMANGQDMAPRSMYSHGTPRSGSHDSYGFAAPHSHPSSLGSGAAYPYYNSYSGSVDGGSMTDYSSASEDARALPGTSQLIGGFPPEPQAMMNQFNAKVSTSTQKKHKCKICDKRFTRPSSLQTHMFSHTGEKPFACDFEGCGRQFSVVSNLRRHKKVHTQNGREDTAGTSPADDE